MPSLLALVVSGREQMARAGIPPDQAAIDAEVLARHVAGWDRATYLARRDDPVDRAIAERFATALMERLRRVPVAYITGHREFWGRDFLVTPAVLIPRPETELVIELALTRLQDKARRWRIADVGTGSGCLAVTLAKELSGSRVIATDISSDALAIAGRNADRLGVADRVTFVRASLLGGLAGPFDLIVANPPYVPRSARDGLTADVKDHEPSVAIFGGGRDGLDEVRALLLEAPGRLAPGGWLLMEFGFGQAESVKAAAAAAGFDPIQMVSDLQGLERTLVVRTSL
jgi:release factor glutamine methyltransferase